MSGFPPAGVAEMTLLQRLQMTFPDNAPKETPASEMAREAPFYGMSAENEPADAALVELRKETRMVMKARKHLRMARHYVALARTTGDRKYLRYALIARGAARALRKVIYG